MTKPQYSATLPVHCSIIIYDCSKRNDTNHCLMRRMGPWLERNTHHHQIRRVRSTCIKTPQLQRWNAHAHAPLLILHRSALWVYTGSRIHSWCAHWAGRCYLMLPCHYRYISSILRFQAHAEPWPQSRRSYIGIFATAFSMSWFNTSISLLASYILHLAVWLPSIHRNS